MTGGKEPKDSVNKKHKSSHTKDILIAVLCVALLLGGIGYFVVPNLMATKLTDDDMAVITETVREDIRSYITQDGSNAIQPQVLLNDLSDAELEEFQAGVASIVTTNLSDGISESQLNTISEQIKEKLTNITNTSNVTLSDEDIEMIAQAVAILIKQDLADLLTDYITRSEMNELLGSLQNDIDNISNSITELTNKYTEVTNQITNIQNIVNQPDTETINQISQCTTDIQYLDQELTELTATLENYNYNLEQMISSLGNEFTVQIEVQQTQIIELQVQLSELTSTLEQLSTQTTERFDLLEQELNTNIEQTNQLLQQSVIELQSYIDGNATDIRNLTATLDETAASLTEYINLCDKNQTENLERNVSLINQTIDALDSQVHDEMDEMNDTLNEKIDKNNQDINDKVDSNVSLINQTIDALTKTVEQNEINRDRAMQEMNTNLTNTMTSNYNSLYNYTKSVEAQLPKYTWGTDSSGQTMVTVTTPN